jgi:hypothetical protein
MKTDCWKRDPQKWISILPTEPGIYWWKETKKHNAVITDVYINDKDKKLYATMPSGFGMQLTMVRGRWQGPITPHGGAR